VSGQGRKKSQRGASVHRSQPASKQGTAASRAKSGPTPPRQAGASRSGAVPRSEQTQPLPVGPRRPPPSSASSRPGNRSSRETRHARAQRRKRNQRIGVVIGALALAGALVGSVLLGQQNDSTAQAQDPGVRSSAAASAGTTTAPAATASATPVTPMVISCPTGGGATVTFGHEIVVPAPYKVTITYGDGDRYTNDSAHLGAIFSHTYKKAGTYAVSAVLTAPDGGTATANCSYTWGP
jgi:hypothetical protein